MPEIFCGNGDVVPPGYDLLGTRYECLRKGFGAGRFSSKSYKDNTYKYYLFLLVILATIAAGAGTYFYLSTQASASKRRSPSPRQRKMSYKDEKDYTNHNVS